MAAEKIFRNARIVLEDEVITGSIKVVGSRIAAVDAGTATAGEDFGGDYLIPGLIELHTDHLEGHYAPRPGVRWNPVAAVQAHDAQIATSGITTVFDCLRMGADEDGGFAHGEMRLLADAIGAAQADGCLRAEHFLHLRCEVSAPDVLRAVDEFANEPMVRMASLMDHSPGQRQFQTMDQYTLYYKTKRGMSDDAFARYVELRQQQSERFSAIHRASIAEFCRARGVIMASHDDATLDHVAQAVEQGVRVAEFPTSLDAARASHEAGLAVLMGAPNIVRGGSHSGNIAAATLSEAGILDVLSSDYVPSSLLHAVFKLVDESGSDSLPKAIALVTSNPASAVGMNDRGMIAEGRRADFLRVDARRDIPVVRSVWRAGERMA